MRRRQFITFLSGAAAWPVAARAQRQDRTRRVGVLMALAQNDPEAQLRVQAFETGLRELGWVEGRNLSLDRRWVPDAGRLLAQATELIGLAPDLILAVTTPVMAGLLPMSRTLPIVFVQVTRRRGDRMRRREFISLVGGAVAAWPLAARAQQSGRLTRLGLLGPTLNNPPAIAPYQAFRTQLVENSWMYALGHASWLGSGRDRFRAILQDLSRNR